MKKYSEKDIKVIEIKRNIKVLEKYIEGMPFPSNARGMFESRVERFKKELKELV